MSNWNLKAKWVGFATLVALGVSLFDAHQQDKVRAAASLNVVNTDHPDAPSLGYFQLGGQWPEDYQGIFRYHYRSSGYAKGNPQYQFRKAGGGIVKTTLQNARLAYYDDKLWHFAVDSHAMDVASGDVRLSMDVFIDKVSNTVKAVEHHYHYQTRTQCQADAEALWARAETLFSGQWSRVSEEHAVASAFYSHITESGTGRAPLFSQPISHRLVTSDKAFGAEMVNACEAEQLSVVLYQQKRGSHKSMPDDNVDDLLKYIKRDI